MVQMTVQSYKRSLQDVSESQAMSRCESLSSSHSLTGAPQSITEWLALWEKDPVEILLDLGFGTEEPDVCTKIPPRFLSGASVAKGINIRVFLEAQKKRMDIERPNLYEHFRQLEVLDNITSAFSSLLTDVNTQQTKAQDTVRDETGLLDAVRSRPVVTQAKQRIGQILKRASQQTMLQKWGSLAPGEANLPSRKEQTSPYTDTADRGTVQSGFSARVTLGCLIREQTSRDKGALAYPTSQCPPTPPAKTWTLPHPVAKQPRLFPACEVPATDRPRKEPPLLVDHVLKKVADLNCKQTDSSEMEEIQSFEDETPCGNASDTTSAVAMVTRTSSCQSDSSGFTEELPEPVALQNVLSSGKMNFISNIHNQETALSQRTVFPMLNEDFQQKPDDGVAKVFITDCESILTVPRLMKAYSDQGEEDHLLLTAGNGHKQMNVAFTETSDINPTVNSESKIRGEDESERYGTEKDVGVACCKSSRGDHTGDVTGPQWGVEVASKDGNPLPVNEVTNRQKFCKMNIDSKNTRWSPKMGLPESLQWGSAVQSGSSTASSCYLEVSWRHPSCIVEGPGLSLSEDQKTRGIGEVLGANKTEQGGTVQNSEMASAPLKSVTVQMSSGLEFTSRAKGTGQNAPLSDSLAREDPVDFYSTLVHCSEGGPLIQSDPGASKDCVKQSTEASNRTDIPAKKPKQPPLLWPPHTNLKKSASLDNVLCGKYRSCYWAEASGAGGVQGSHCCHCCCCHGCCLWTSPVAVSPQCPVGCSSNHISAKLQLLKMLMIQQDTAVCDLDLCTLHEIEAMKSSCQHFQEKLDEIEQHLTKQQVLFSSAMPDEGREEGRYLQLLRRAVRREVAELEFWLNDGACQVRENILMQLDQLLAEQSHLFSELRLSDWKGERKAQNKQAFPDDAADTAHPQSGCSKMALQRDPSENTTARGSLPALQPGVFPTQFPTRTTSEPNSAELSTSKKEIKGPPQAKMDFKAFMHNLKKSFQNSLGNDSAEGKD